MSDIADLPTATRSKRSDKISPNAKYQTRSAKKPSKLFVVITVLIIVLFVSSILLYLYLKHLSKQKKKKPSYDDYYQTILPPNVSYPYQPYTEYVPPQQQYPHPEAEVNLEEAHYQPSQEATVQHPSFASTTTLHQPPPTTQDPVPEPQIVVSCKKQEKEIDDPRVSVKTEQETQENSLEDVDEEIDVRHDDNMSQERLDLLMQQRSSFVIVGGLKALEIEGDP